MGGKPYSQLAWTYSFVTDESHFSKPATVRLRVDSRVGSWCPDMLHSLCDRACSGRTRRDIQNAIGSRAVSLASTKTFSKQTAFSTSTWFP